ncbi:hypothetical protein FHQ08_02205 [Lactobacillus sp. CC-MHH1034]|uniref:hypothetical protein n=1 Tax=Agrilactobacillus fermenti TaxID=2586909 RepID=UPI001E355FBD|nr:hypothetical protein [Agrilactobacillus fermenti]MCD2255525.1 hypothetical protein [Agrilactobacillus fermenti]
MDRFDYRTVEKQEYTHATRPAVVILNERNYITFRGAGKFSVTDTQFMRQVNVMYDLATEIRQAAQMSKQLDWFRDYVPYPLNSFWDGFGGYLLMIKQPNFTVPELLTTAKANLAAKYPSELLQQVNFERLAEGTKVQSFNAGPVVPGNDTFQRLDTFIKQHKARRLNQGHREVYLRQLTLGMPPTELEVLVRYQIAISNKILASDRFLVTTN